MLYWTGSVKTAVQRFSKFLQLPVATASNVWANQRAEFKSFCNLIGWHGSRSCNRMLQELGKVLYLENHTVYERKSPPTSGNLYVRRKRVGLYLSSEYTLLTLVTKMTLFRFMTLLTLIFPVAKNQRKGCVPLMCKVALRICALVKTCVIGYSVHVIAFFHSYQQQLIIGNQTFCRSVILGKAPSVSRMFIWKR